jgi:hypothetical protein
MATRPIPRKALARAPPPHDPGGEEEHDEEEAVIPIPFDVEAMTNVLGAFAASTLLLAKLGFQVWMVWDARRTYLETAAQTERMRARTRAMEAASQRRI